MQNRTLYSSAQALLAFIGCADAGTLYWAHRNNIELPCTSGNGCDLVYASHWSHVLGIPIALIGLAAYLVFLFASVLKLTSDSERLKVLLFRIILLPSFFGTVFSWYLQYVASVYIGAFCIYCRVSAFVMTFLFLSALIELSSARFKSVKPTNSL
jgi:uncharacterized membrane protein